MKVLIGSQTWAWGPASKAEVLGYYLTNTHNFDVHFVGDKVSYDFCAFSESFSKCTCLDDETDFSEIDFSSYDFVISVMNPYLAIYAYKNQTKVFWVDSMSWIWNWNNYFEIKDNYDNIISLPTDEIISKMKDMHHYDCKIFGLICSSWLFIQGDYYKREIVKPESEYVGAVINTSLKVTDEVKDTILISLSGQLCPYMNLDQAISYGNKIQYWLKDVIEKYKKQYKVIVAGNSAVIDKLNRYPGVTYGQLKHDEFIQLLNKTKALFCPSGFTTIYEAAAYNVPMFFLPETHDGNAYEFLLVTNGATNEQRDAYFPNLLLDVESKDINEIVDEEITMSRLKRCYEKMEVDLDTQLAQKNIISKIINLIDSDDNISSNQCDIINRTIKVNGAVEQIIDRILSLL